MSDTATAIAAGATAITWFEIPSAKLDRAIEFYSAILESQLKVQEMAGERLAVLPYERPGVGGALVEGSPNAAGTVIYLNVDGHLDRALERAQAAGGRVDTPKTALPPGMGWYARIIDSEGNRVGLHAIS
jgi:uncharacterized protein